MKNFFNRFKRLTKWFFTPSNIIKISIIFIIGIVSRYLINEYLDINVFVNYLSSVSILFYLGYSSFIVIINEIFSYYDVNNWFYSFINTLSKLWLGSKYYFSNICIRLKQLMFGKSINYFDDVRYTKMEGVRYSTTNTNYSVARSRWYEESSPPSSSRSGTSFYNNVAQENPYIDPAVLPNSERIRHPSRYPSLNYERVPHPSHYYDPNSPNQARFYQNGDYNRSGNSDSPRYFIIDSFDDNGQVIRYSYSSNGDYTVSRNAYLATPRLSNLTTPSTMTPLFNSSESLEQSGNPSSNSLHTNDTNHATVGENRSSDYVNWEARRHQVGRAFESLASQEGYALSREVQVPFEKNRGKISLGAKYHGDSSIHSLYIKYHDIAKRKFFWNIWEKGRNSYDSYEEFKKNFDPKTNIWKEIAKTTKKDISREIRDLLKSDPFGTKRSTISTRNIGRISTSRTQEELNNLNSNRYNAYNIRKSRR